MAIIIVGTSSIPSNTVVLKAYDGVFYRIIINTGGANYSFKVSIHKSVDGMATWIALDAANSADIISGDATSPSTLMSIFIRGTTMHIATASKGVVDWYHISYYQMNLSTGLFSVYDEVLFDATDGTGNQYPCIYETPSGKVLYSGYDVYRSMGSGVSRTFSAQRDGVNNWSTFTGGDTTGSGARLGAGEAIHRLGFRITGGTPAVYLAVTTFSVLSEPPFFETWIYHDAITHSFQSNTTGLSLSSIGVYSHNDTGRITFHDIVNDYGNGIVCDVYYDTNTTQNKLLYYQDSSDEFLVIAMVATGISATTWSSTTSTSTGITLTSTQMVDSFKYRFAVWDNATSILNLYGMGTSSLNVNKLVILAGASNVEVEAILTAPLPTISATLDTPDIEIIASLVVPIPTITAFYRNITVKGTLTAPIASMNVALISMVANESASAQLIAPLPTISSTLRTRPFKATLVAPLPTLSGLLRTRVITAVLTAPLPTVSAAFNITGQGLPIVSSLTGILPQITSNISRFFGGGSITSSFAILGQERSANDSIHYYAEINQNKLPLIQFTLRSAVNDSIDLTIPLDYNSIISSNITEIITVYEAASVGGITYSNPIISGYIHKKTEGTLSDLFILRIGVTGEKQHLSSNKKTLKGISYTSFSIGTIRFRGVFTPSIKATDRFVYRDTEYIITEVTSYVGQNQSFTEVLTHG